MALTFAEQELYDFAKAALPSWVRDQDEFLISSAKMFGSVRALIDYLFGQTLIGTADGPEAGPVDWLNQHARDRGTSRQKLETTPALRQRLQQVPDALTRGAVLAAIQAALDTAGVVGPVALLELPRDGAWIGAYAAMTGVGGSFTKNGTKLQFTPAVLPWPALPWQAPGLFPVMQFQLSIGSIALAANADDYTPEGLIGNAVIVDNPIGVAGTDPALTWTVVRFDLTGQITDGFARSFISRGYRIARQRPFQLLVILPFGTAAGTEASVREALRTKKAAGFGVIVERRTSP